MAIADPAPQNMLRPKRRPADTALAVDELSIDYACNRLQMTPPIHNVAMSLKERLNYADNSVSLPSPAELAFIIPPGFD